VTISDGVNTPVSHTFIVTIINLKPRFRIIHRNKSYQAGNFTEIYLPDVYDPEGASVTVVCTNIKF
jgi:hypothetical protein